MLKFTPMVREFKYCENPEAEVPRLFIDKEIGGNDADGNPNIQGNTFLKELLHLSDTEGKKRIEVWINSPGGIVVEGQSIYAAELASLAEVDTICYGIAASIAGVIFQGGRKRKMYDYSTLMYHPAYSEDGKVDKGLEALNKAICIMVAKRSGKTEDEIWAIMNRGKASDKGTWIGAEEALAMGFCDEIIKSDSQNKNSIQAETTTGMWKAANKIFNRAIEKPTITKRMNKILNKALGLNEEASEEAAVAAFSALNKTMESLQKKHDDLKKKLDDCEKEMDAMKKDKAKADEEMKAKADEEAKAKAKADEEAKNKKEADDKAKADEEMKNAVAAGKIKNDAPTIEKWKAMYAKDFEGTKAIVATLAGNKVSPEFVPAAGDAIKDNEFEAAARRAGLKPGTAKWYNAIQSFKNQSGK